MIKKHYLNLVHNSADLWKIKPQGGAEKVLQFKKLLVSSSNRFTIRLFMRIIMEARVGIEPTLEDLQSPALPLGYRARNGRLAGPFPRWSTRPFNSPYKRQKGNGFKLFFHLHLSA